MCGSLLDIKSVAAEIRRGKKKIERRRRRRRRRNHRMKNYGLPYSIGRSYQVVTVI